MDDAGETANYCSHCGGALEEDANYCPQCGTRLHATTPARAANTENSAARTGTDDSAARTGTNSAARTGTNSAASTSTIDAGATSETDADTTDEELIAFRRRVQDHIGDGWDLKQDYGDSVVLADRGLGTPWVHGVLLIFTAGVGNLAYGWYSHSYDADRKVLRADGTTRDDFDAAEHEEVADDSGDALSSYVLGALLLLIGIGSIAGSPLDPVSLVVGLLFIAAAAWRFPPTRRRLENRHPVTTFGPTRSIETTTVSDPSTPCVMCASPVTEGVERRYREEYVFAGVPLFTTESGENTYCQDCAMGGVEDVGVAPVTLATDTDGANDSDGAGDSDGASDSDGDRESSRPVEADSAREFES